MKYLIVACLLAAFVVVQGKNLRGIQVPKSSAVTLKDYYGTHISSSRIISGQLASRGQLPHQVAIWMYMTAGGRTFCGGSLISTRWVLTAAHCVKGVTYWYVKLGSVRLDIFEEGQMLLVSNRGIVHPNYNSYLNNDIGLVRLPTDAILSNYIQVIRLPRRADVENALANIEVTMSGWGKTSDADADVTNYLNWVNLTTISNEECAKYHGSQTVISSTLCCKGHPEHSPCNGDSGGPLIRTESDGESTLVGIVSFVHDDGCESGKPSGFVRTASFLDWIRKHTGIEVRP